MDIISGCKRTLTMNVRTSVDTIAISYNLGLNARKTYYMPNGTDNFLDINERDDFVVSEVHA